ncbi:MAG: hypothetical protein EOP04_11965 [Proteobacteria bacterium]|nr:MAG: hypothetical protein EOP04_11965 [Pseudomonadota bacterium]
MVLGQILLSLVFAASPTPVPSKPVAPQPAKRAVVPKTTGAPTVGPTRPRAKPVGNTGAAPLAAPAGAPKVAVAAADPCGGRPRKDYLEIGPEAYFRIIEKGTATVLSLNTDFCYLSGMSLKIQTVRDNEAILSERIYRGTVIVRSIQLTTFDKARQDPRLLLKKKDNEEYLLRITKRQKKTKDTGSNVYIVTVDRPALEVTRKQYGAPGKHPMAKNVNGQQLRAKLAEGKHVYDVRAAELFKKHPLKGAKNLPATDYSILSKKVLTAGQMKRLKISFNKNLLPKNKEAEIYLLSLCAGEYSSYNFVTLVREAGYRNVSWFRPGILEMKKTNSGCDTPASVSGAKIATADEIVNLLSEKTTRIIDTRNVWKKEQFNIRGSKRISFRQKLNKMGLPEHRGSVTLAELRKAKETFVGGKDDVIPGRLKTDTVILYGQNEYDWTAYKAALILSSIGYKNIYWYRFGFDDWKAHALVNPKRYPLSKKADKSDLYL